MEKEYGYLLHLLKSFIHKEVPEKQEDINWNMLIQLAGIHSVTGILGYMVKQYQLVDTPEMLQEIGHLCMRNFALYSIKDIRMQQLIQKMNQEHIDHILFKGYVLKDYYSIPELRSYGDIDFVIRLKDRDRSNRLMMHQGYQVTTDWEPVMSYYKDTEYYEIHTDIMEIDVSDKADYKGYFKKMWDYAVRVDQHTWQFTPEFHFIYLLTHIAKHIYSSGAGIRMYMDIAVFIQHFEDKIDWDFIYHELQKIKLYDFCNVVLTAVKEWFDVQGPLDIQEPSKEVLDEFLGYTMEAGVYGHVNRETGVNELKRAGKENKKISRFAIVMKRLFPKASDIEKRYTYLQNKHWLLPVAWVHRLFKTKETWGQHVHEAEVIMSADTEKVDYLRKMQKDIGL